MGQCSSEEDLAELANKLNITEGELVKTAARLNIETTAELSDVAQDSIENLPADIATFEEYRDHVSNITANYNQKWETLSPKASAYEAVAISWEAAYDELERALEEIKIDGRCEEANLASAQEGIPLPLAVLHQASEARGMSIGQETN